MQNCPRSCPSRRTDPDELRRIDNEDDSLSLDICKDILAWKKGMIYPLSVDSFGVSTYDLQQSRFQEFRKAGNEMKFQLRNGSLYIRSEQIKDHPGSAL